MNDLRKACRTTMLIGIWMMGCVLVYGVIVELVKSGTIPYERPAAPPFLRTVKTVLFGVATAVFFLIQIVRTRVLSANRPVSGRGKPNSYSPDIQKLIAASVASFALCESIGILGLVLFLLGGSSTDFYVFLLISLFFFSVYFPNYGRWEEWMRDRIASERKK